MVSPPRLLLALTLLLGACAGIPSVAPGPEDALERQALLMEALDGAPLLAGNHIDILRDGAETFPAMFRAIAGARDHVNLEFYILEDVHAPGMADSLFTLLAAKLREGVAVTLLYDSFGSAPTPRAAFAELQRLGARVLEFNPLDPTRARGHWLPNNRDHRKILVVDGRIAFMGGVNLDRVYENACHGPSTGFTTEQDTQTACWRDTSIRLEGPTVAELQKLFLHNWQAQGGEALPARNWFPPLPPRGPARMRLLGSAPAEGAPRYYLTLTTALRGARQRIWASTGFFVPTHDEREALAHAARRGVDVRLVLPAWNDSPSALAAGHAAYDDLLEAGVRIFEMEHAVLHSKLVTVDGAWSAIGSSNLDRRSVALNDEVDAIVLGRETAAAVERVLAADMAEGREIKLDAWRQRSLGARLRELSSRLVIDLL
jgi:cardiolipin synthase